MVDFELIDSYQLAIRFPYDEKLVEAIKALPERRWNKTKKQWEMPLAHLREAAESLEVKWESVPKQIREAFDKVGAGKTLLLVENVYTQIIGVDLPMSVLEEITSYWVEGAEYSKIYQDGHWDGYRHLMRRRGPLSFPTGLLATVEKSLSQAGHDFSIQDKRTPPELTEPFLTAGPELRDYQTEALENLTANERGVLQLATGAGKTLLAAHLIARKALPSIFFVHTKDLLYQTVHVMEDTLEGQTIGVVGDGRAEPARVTVATIQTAVRALDLKPKKQTTDEVPVWKDEAAASLSETDRQRIARALDQCQLLVFDECHHIPAESFYEIAMSLPNAYYRYGLSATPWRSDQSDLMIEAALGPKLCVVRSTDLINRGYLVAPMITMYEILPTGRRLPRQFAGVYKSEVVEHPERNAIIAEVAEHAVKQGKSVLILVNQIQHGKILEQAIDVATFIHGKDSGEVREEALDRLRSKTDQVLIATTLADEGLDLPSLDVLILAGAGKSETRALQRVGRAIRPYPGKKKATIVDFWDQCQYLEEHSRQRFEIYQTEPAFEVEIRPPRKRDQPKKSRQKILAEN